MLAAVTAAAVASLIAAAAGAQKTVSKGAVLEVKAKIVALDSTSRLVTLLDDTGESETIYAGPEVKRFDELKVGDTVNFRYYESVAHGLRGAGGGQLLQCEREHADGADLHGRSPLATVVGSWLTAYCATNGLLGAR